jgi:hypothetical protein
LNVLGLNVKIDGQYSLITEYMWWHKENPLPQLPFAVIEKSLDGYLPEFEQGTNIDKVPVPEGEFSFSPIDEQDKYTTGCQCCIAVLAQGKDQEGSKILSVIFHIDPSSVDGAWFLNLNKPPYFKLEFPGIMRQLKENTIKETRVIGIAGGYVGGGGGRLTVMNRSFYGKMVAEVKKISRREDFPEPIILQPPKQYISYTDVYWETQKGNITIVTRPDHSPHPRDEYQ